jgi:hypothetical protein
MKTKCMSCGGSMKKMQKGGSKDKWGRSSSSDWYGFDPKNKKWTGNKALSSAELKALSHQKRGMGKSYGTYVKKYNSIINDLGHLTSSQQTQLNKYMSKASLPKKIYEGLPNIGTIVGSSAADIPKGSKLKKQKIGGMVKKMQNGGSIKKKPLLPAPKSKTGMDALKALGKYVSTFGFATEGYNPAPSKKAKKTTPKMAVGGTTTKRIIKKSTGGMYGIPQENLGTSGQYGFAQKGGGVTSGIAKKIISTAKKSNPNIKNLYDKNGNKKSKAQFILQQMKTDLKNKTVKKYQKGGTHIMPNGKVMLDSKMKKGGATKAAKFAALAPPYDKATFADRIAGAKKSVKKKK